MYGTGTEIATGTCIVFKNCQNLYSIGQKWTIPESLSKIGRILDWLEQTF